MNELFRQTGRTTRLVERAVHEAAGGRAVYIIVDRHSHIKHVQIMVNEMWDHLRPGRGGHGIKVESPADFGRWMHEFHHTFNQKEERYLCSHPNCLWLLDHTLVEHMIREYQDDIKQNLNYIATLLPHTY